MILVRVGGPLWLLWLGTIITAWSAVAAAFTA